MLVRTREWAGNCAQNQAARLWETREVPYALSGGYFDLDGTLLNTLRDLHAAVNVALKGQGFGEKTLDEVRSYVGNAVRVLFERALPEEAPERREACVAAFKEYYSSHINVYTRPYPGILALLERLQKAGVKRVFERNKFDAAVAFVRSAFWRAFG